MWSIENLDTITNQELKAPNVEVEVDKKKKIIIQFLMALTWAIGGTQTE